MNGIGSVTPIISTPIAGAVLQNDVSANVAHIIILYLTDLIAPSPGTFHLTKF
jgi:hypothetical protein